MQVYVESTPAETVKHSATYKSEQQSANSSAQKHALATTVTQGKRKRDEDMARQKEKTRELHKRSCESNL